MSQFFNNNKKEIKTNDLGGSWTGRIFLWIHCALYAGGSNIDGLSGVL